MQNQPMLFPPDVSDLIPANAMVRAAGFIVNPLDRKSLTDLYPGGGASAYGPVHDTEGHHPLVREEHLLQPQDRTDHARGRQPVMVDRHAPAGA